MIFNSVDKGLVCAHRFFRSQDVLSQSLNVMVFTIMVEPLLCPNLVAFKFLLMMIAACLTYLRDVYQRPVDDPVGYKWTPPVVFAFLLQMCSWQLSEKSPGTDDARLAVFIYFILSGIRCGEVNFILTQVLRLTHIECCEGQDTNIIIIFTSGLALLVATAMFVVEFYKNLLSYYFTAPIVYFGLILPSLKIFYNHVKPLVHNTKILNSIRRATPNDIKREKICQVCQNPMSMARVLMCGHVFHGKCLLAYLKENDTCALCHQLILRE